MDRNKSLPPEQQNINSPAIAYHQASVCVPVQVIPFASTGDVVTECCGAPTITPGVRCTGDKNGSCFFTISQELCFAVPIAFGAVATVIDTYVKPGEVAKQSIMDCCNGE